MMSRRAWMVMSVAVLAGLFWADTAAEAKKQRWTTVAESLQSGGDAKEVSVNRQITKVRFRATSGVVVINTFWVRDGGARRQITVGRRLESGQEAVIEIGGRQNVSGLRIGDGGGRTRGTYAVDVQ
jgi:hypothetical protein